MKAGKKIIILSDKKISSEFAPIPSLLSVGAVHQHLVEKRIRTQAGLVVEAGDAWEVHHFATIIGYGASAVNPYMALETIHFMNKEGLFYKPLKTKSFASLPKSSAMSVEVKSRWEQHATVLSVFTDF